MKKHKGILPQSMPFQVYKALDESRLPYADVVWGSLSQQQSISPSETANRAVDVIGVSKKRTP